MFVEATVQLSIRVKIECNYNTTMEDIRNMLTNEADDKVKEMGLTPTFEEMTIGDFNESPSLLEE